MVKASTSAASAPRYPVAGGFKNIGLPWLDHGQLDEVAFHNAENDAHAAQLFFNALRNAKTLISG